LYKLAHGKKNLYTVNYTLVDDLQLLFKTLPDVMNIKKKYKEKQSDICSQIQISPAVNISSVVWEITRCSIVDSNISLGHTPSS